MVGRSSASLFSPGSASLRPNPDVLGISHGKIADQVAISELNGCFRHTSWQSAPSMSPSNRSFAGTLWMFHRNTAQSKSNPAFADRKLLPNFHHTRFLVISFTDLSNLLGNRRHQSSVIFVHGLFVHVLESQVVVSRRNLAAYNRAGTRKSAYNPDSCDFDTWYFCSGT